MKLGKLKKVDLREYWKHEAYHFTQWLAEPDNLSELGDELGIDISLDPELIQTESGVGRFNADIIVQEQNTGRKIVIENQLEATDHCHLGQILTYAAGIEAEYIVWIVSKVGSGLKDCKMAIKLKLQSFRPDPTSLSVLMPVKCGIVLL